MKGQIWIKQLLVQWQLGKKPILSFLDTFMYKNTGKINNLT